MTNDVLSIQMEELVLTLQTLTEHQQEQLADGKAQSQANEQFTKQITEIIKPLSSLLKTYQAKEQFITENTSEILKKNINDVFTQNQSAYHATIIKGFNQHIDTATKHLSTATVEATQLLKDLETAAINSKTEFVKRQDFFKLQEDTYDKQSRKLKESVDKTLTKVAKDTEDKLSDIGHDFTASLTWKMTGMLGCICLALILLTFAIAWLFVPSKADIAERRANYAELERYQVADNVAKGTDGYYADVITSTCFKSRDSKTWCKFR